jgi:hypothetical protein
MPFALVAWLVFGFVALVVLHELTHVMIAHWHGHRTVCVAINVVGVAVVFEDSPRIRYWASQVVLPAIVTWITCYVWLYVFLTYPSNLQSRLPHPNVLDFLMPLVTLLTVLTSGGDVLSALREMHKPVWGEDRVHRDFQVLRKIPNLIVFTRHGRERWHAVWTEGSGGRATSTAT